MSIDNKPYYPAYKDSGVPWLGQVPEHWEVKPGRACFREKKEANSGLKETTVLSLSYGRIVVKPTDKLHGLVPASFETYQIVAPGDIIIRPTDLQNDWNSLRFGLSSHRGIITSAYLCFRTETFLAREYGFKLLHTYDLKKIFYGLGSGLRQNLDWGDFKYLPCLVPPLAEQASIIRYLDFMDRRIGKLIRAKQKLIKLLEEQKQAIIHRAVTRGLDPNVSLRPSGVEWLGDVPEHWDVRPLKHWARINVETLAETTDPEFEFRYIDIGSVGTGKLVQQPQKMLFRDAPSRARRILYKGDTIISTVRTYLKAVWFVNEDADDLIASTGFAVLIPRKIIEPTFLRYGIQDNSFVDLVSACSVGVSYPAIAETVLGRLPISIPPDRSEQAEIVNAIEVAISPTESIVDNLQNTITLLHEYRTRLISDVVTGKLDVRKAAAGLPDEIEDDGATEELEEIEIEVGVSESEEAEA